MAGERIPTLPIDQQASAAAVPPQYMEGAYTAAAGAPEPQRVVVEHVIAPGPGFIRRHKVGLGLATVAVAGAAYIANSLFGGPADPSKPPMTPSMALDYVKIDYSTPLLEAGGHSRAVADGKLVSCLIPALSFTCLTMPDAGITVSATATGPVSVEAEPGSITLSPGKDPAGEDVVIATVSDLRPDLPGQPAKPGITVNTKNIEVTKGETRKIGSLTSNDVSDAEFKLAFDGATGSYKDETGKLLQGSIAPALAAVIKQWLNNAAKGVGNTDAAAILKDRASKPIGIQLPSDLSLATNATWEKTAKVPCGGDIMHVSVQTAPDASISPQFASELQQIERSKGYFIVGQNQTQSQSAPTH